MKSDSVDDLKEKIIILHKKIVELVNSEKAPALTLMVALSTAYAQCIAKCVIDFGKDIDGEEFIRKTLRETEESARILIKNIRDSKSKGKHE